MKKKNATQFNAMQRNAAPETITHTNTHTHIHGKLKAFDLSCRLVVCYCRIATTCLCFEKAKATHSSRLKRKQPQQNANHTQNGKLVLRLFWLMIKKIQINVCM